MKQLLKKAHRFSRRNLLIIGGACAIAAVALGYAMTQGNNNTPTTPKASAAVQKVTQTTAVPVGLQGEWAYLPGTAQDGRARRILPANFAIVNQDGSGGQPNPSVNLFGTHFAVNGDFAVDVSLAQLKGPASVQFYGEVPVVYDEFRVERKSVRVAINGTALTVSLWNGRGQQPVATQTATLAAASDHAIIHLIRKGATLGITVNGTTLSLPDQGVFAAGNVWLGMSADTTSWLFDNIKVGGINGGTTRAINTVPLKIATDPQGLQVLATAKRPDFKVGAAMALAPSIADSAYAAVAYGGNFGSLTTENALKWQFVHPSKDLFTFQESDALVALALRHGMQVHGHALVFGEANPKWIQDTPPAEREAIMIAHIKRVVGHFKGKVATWDVINEPFDDDEWDQLRPHIWYKAMGESYISKALITAHQADPAAKLFINDYGLEEDGDRWNAMLALVKKLKSQGVPIDGVGFQAHVYERGDKINASVLRKHFQQLAALGLLARVSEMDVYSEDGQANQASQYSQVFGACLAEANCVSFTTWGVTDRYDMFRDDDGTLEYGEDFLWDRNLKPTPAVEAIRALLR